MLAAPDREKARLSRRGSTPWEQQAVQRLPGQRPLAESAGELKLMQAKQLSVSVLQYIQILVFCDAMARVAFSLSWFSR